MKIPGGIIMKLLVVIASILCTLFVAGCSEHEGLNVPSTVAYEKQLKEDTNIRELLSIRNEMMKRVLESGVSGAEISDIVERNDTQKFASILGYTDEEMTDMGKRIAYLGKVIQDKYPELHDMAGSQREECPGCNFKAVAEKWDYILENRKEADVFVADGDENQVPLPDPSQRGVACQWLPYTASLALCTAAGPVLYWACAVVAMCAFCSGGIVNTIC